MSVIVVNNPRKTQFGWIWIHEVLPTGDERLTGNSADEARDFSRKWGKKSPADFINVVTGIQRLKARTEFS